MLPNSLALIAAKVVTMGLGFAFWLLAARLFAPAEVGVAAGVVAAVLLCVQLALLGVGSAVISLAPEHRAAPARLLDTSFTLVAVAGVVVGALFVMLAAGALPELGVVARAPAYTALFVAITVAGALGVLLDQIATTLRRGDHALARGALNGLLSLGCLAAIGAAAAWDGSMAIFACWAAGGAAACALGAVQLRRTLAGYRPRARVSRPLARRLVAVGLPNHGLTLAERAPGLVLPILVTELLSPEANATWYAVWMAAWVVFVVPVQVGMTLFAEASHRPHAIDGLVRHGVRLSLGVGLVAAAVVAVLADPVLSLLGAGYAEQGATPLRVLVCGLVPLAIIHAYYARCRAVRRHGEAIATAVVGGALTVAVAIVSGVGAGLTAMAIAWVAAQGVIATWTAVRLRALRSRPGGRLRPLVAMSADGGP